MEYLYSQERLSIAKISGDSPMNLKVSLIFYKKFFLNIFWSMINHYLFFKIIKYKNFIFYYKYIYSIFIGVKKIKIYDNNKLITQ